MLTRRSFSRLPSVATAIAAFAVPFIAANAQPQPALACDAADFTGLDLPATRIVSAAALRDDERAPPIASYAQQSTSVSGRTARRTQSVSRCACRKTGTADISIR